MRLFLEGLGQTNPVHQHRRLLQGLPFSQSTHRRRVGSDRCSTPAQPPAPGSSIQAKAHTVDELGQIVAVHQSGRLLPGLLFKPKHPPSRSPRPSTAITPLQSSWAPPQVSKTRNVNVTFLNCNFVENCLIYILILINFCNCSCWLPFTAVVIRLCRALVLLVGLH